MADLSRVDRVRVGGRLRTLVGAGPATELSSQNVADPEPGESERELRAADLNRSRTQRWARAEGPKVSQRDLGLVCKLGLEVTSKDQGLRLCLTWSYGLYPMCSDSYDSE